MLNVALYHSTQDRKISIYLKYEDNLFCFDIYIRYVVAKLQQCHFYSTYSSGLRIQQMDVCTSERPPQRSMTWMIYHDNILYLSSPCFCLCLNIHLENKNRRIHAMWRRLRRQLPSWSKVARLMRRNSSLISAGWSHKKPRLRKFTHHLTRVWISSSAFMARVQVRHNGAVKITCNPLTDIYRTRHSRCYREATTERGQI